MKFALAFYFFAGGPPAPRDDAWFGDDKLLHFIASAAVQGAAYSVFHRNAHYSVAAQRASIVTLSVGIGKEVYDALHPDTHDASLRDLAWDGLGGAAATIAIKQSLDSRH